jgi:hypothetical protein
MAADPVGAAFGAVAVSRLLRPASRARAIGPLAVLTGVPLTLVSGIPKAREADMKPASAIVPPWRRLAGTRLVYTGI